MNIKCEGRRGKLKKIWMDCVRNNMCIKDIYNEMVVDRVEEEMLCQPYLCKVRGKKRY